MKLVLLGTNGAVPTDDAQTMCVMIPEYGLMFDGGTGVYRVSDYLQTPSLNIYLSHAHLDHIMGLNYLFGAFIKKQLDDATARGEEAGIEALVEQADAYMHHVTVHATPSALESLQKQFSELSDLNYKALEGDQSLPDGGVLTYFPLEHGAECMGFRLDWPGHSFAYVTDTITEPELPYVAKLRGVDLLLLDSYLQDKWKHMTQYVRHGYTSGAAQVAAKAQVGRLILIHHNAPLHRINSAELANAQAIFPATEVGRDRMEIEF